MKTSKDISQLINSANEDDLRDIVSGWIEDHPDFKIYVEKCLCPPVEDVDFGRKLSQAVNRETKGFFSRHEVREATDWNSVYLDLIKPWSENAGSLSTEKLYDLIDVIVTEVGMRVKDEDFYGDDWYGDDFSGDIQDIMNVLGNLTGLLMIREDLDSKTMDSLKSLVQTAQKSDVIDDYVGSPYAFMLDLISLREDIDDVSCVIFDRMIKENFGSEAGKWICRKIDFIRSMGLAEEAQKYMEDEIRHPEVCLKFFNELIDARNWQAAITLLDKAQALKDSNQSHYAPNVPNWLELKQQILEEHGSKEDCIENLKCLFYKSYDKSQYYHKLKELVDKSDWTKFYHNLLTNVTGYNTLNDIAPFLIEEGEFDWLFRLVEEAVEKDSTDYRTPLKYAASLRLTHFEEMQSRLFRTIKDYAADRFPPKKKVKSSKYSYFKEDLKSLSDAGYGEINKTIVEYLLQEYRFRPALVNELRALHI